MFPMLSAVQLPSVQNAHSRVRVGRDRATPEWFETHTKAATAAQDVVATCVCAKQL